MKTLKSKISQLTLVACILIAQSACSQFNWNNVDKTIKKTIADNTQKKPLSNDEVIKGLKEALTVGSNNSSTNASKVDGYFKHPVIKIPFPPEAAKVEKTVRDLGMGSQVDKFVLTVNRAAEEAAKSAAPVFVDAVKNMTITDGMNILKGADNAATAYLQKSTTTTLQAKFRPIVDQAIQKVEVTKYWNPVMTAYNNIPFVDHINPDLNSYITGKALDGLFYLVAQEELKIRKDPLARVSDILKRVFGS